jgi:phage baseplate assembly protein gpV
VTRPADRSDWHAAVGAELPVHVDPAERWTLVACTDAVETGGWRSWDVTFRAPAGRGQGTYVLDVPGVGEQAVFVVPTGGTDGSTTLTATFVVAADPTPEGPA